MGVGVGAMIVAGLGKEAGPPAVDFGGVPASGRLRVKRLRVVSLRKPEAR